MKILQRKEKNSLIDSCKFQKVECFGLKWKGNKAFYLEYSLWNETYSSAESLYFENMEYYQKYCNETKFYERFVIKKILKAVKCQQFNMSPLDILHFLKEQMEFYQKQVHEIMFCVDCATQSYCVKCKVWINCSCIQKQCHRDMWIETSDSFTEDYPDCWCFSCHECFGMK